MDKLKPIFVFLKKFHFWVLLGVAAILGIFAWNSASSQLCTEFDQRKSTIAAMVTDMQNISTTPEHPNEEVIKGLQDQTEKLRQQVVGVWSQLYEKQRQDVLKWPAGLTPAFLKVVQNSNFGADITSVDHREEYQEFVKKRLGQLPEIIRAKVSSKPNEGIASGPRPTRGRQPTRQAQNKDEEDAQDYLVVWKGFENLERRFHWEDTPTSMRVWVAQEDLWVYETLLKIIANVNKNAKGAHNATVSVITALEVGDDASSGSLTQGRVMRAQATGDAAAPAEAPPSAEAPAAGVPTAKLSAADLALVNNRYLDTSGRPLPGDQRSQVAEYKRMPIRMSLTMDSKEIPRLLVECANATLPVEVQQVRINPSARGGGHSSSESSTETAAASTRTADDDSADNRKMHVPVIVQGIIYIFNPPDMTKLAPPQGEGQPAPGGAVPGAAPAAGAVPGVPAGGAPGAAPGAHK